MHDYPMLHDQRQWDALCCVRGQNKGTFVEGAPHYTGGSLGLLPASVAESRISKSNSSAHAPTVFVTTHRRMVTLTLTYGNPHPHPDRATTTTRRQSRGSTRRAGGGPASAVRPASVGASPERPRA